MSKISHQPEVQSRHESVCRLRDGTLVFIRPIHPGDAALERDFLSHLSPEYRAYRFLGLIKSPSSRVAEELTHPDSDEAVLVALVESKGHRSEIGVARYRRRDDEASCDCAVTIDPAWQQLGIGRLLMQNLIDLARSNGLSQMYSVDAARCLGAHKLAERLGFRSCSDPEDPASTTFKLDLQ